MLLFSVFFLSIGVLRPWCSRPAGMPGHRTATRDPARPQRRRQAGLRPPDVRASRSSCSIGFLPAILAASIRISPLSKQVMNPGPIHGLLVILIALQREAPIMAGAKERAAIQESMIEEIELDASEIKEFDQLAEETRKRGISWEDLKAELGL